jgi:hypothetical protein
MNHSLPLMGQMKYNLQNTRIEIRNSVYRSFVVVDDIVIFKKRVNGMNVNDYEHRELNGIRTSLFDNTKN